eukprot:1148776-Pelagomonas_calceolata.AAC.2
MEARALACVYLLDTIGARTVPARSYLPIPAQLQQWSKASCLCVPSLHQQSVPTHPHSCFPACEQGLLPARFLCTSRVHTVLHAFIPYIPTHVFQLVSKGSCLLASFLYLRGPHRSCMLVPYHPTNIPLSKQGLLPARFLCTSRAHAAPACFCTNSSPLLCSSLQERALVCPHLFGTL